MPIASSRGGFTLACEWRWMCSHISNNMNSGAKMCMNTISVKKRSLSVLLLRKLLAIGSPNSGRVSSHSVVATAMYCASLSQTSQ